MATLAAQILSEVGPLTLTAVDGSNWEASLCALAHAPARVHHARAAVFASQSAHLQLEEALAHCEAITRRNSKTFFVASALLPGPKRAAVRALYAFCRTVDDIVDAGDGDQAGGKLDLWRRRLAHDAPIERDPVALAWGAARHDFHIPNLYAEQLIDGVRRDLTQTRYETFAELATYCYGVACTVGLMSMHIIGFAGAEAIPYAIRLGTALQLTNILRDVGEDWRRGRVYLPQEELAFFGLGEGDIAAGRVTNAWRRFMRFQIDRARQLYAAAMPGVRLLNRNGRFAIRAAGELYAGILDEIERNDYDVFSRRAALTGSQKARRLPGIWWRAQR
jgi:phytoene synthase